MEIKTAGCPLGAKCEEVKVNSDGDQVLYRCPWYVMVHGVDNNTGETVGNFACAIAWLPTLMINTANESRKGVAATESFRNEMVKQGAQTQQVMLTVAQLPNQRHPFTHEDALGYAGWTKPPALTAKGDK